MDYSSYQNDANITMFSFSFVSFFHLFENKYPPPSRTFNLSTQLYTRDRGYNQSFSRSRHNTMLFTCTTIEELESRAEKIFFFFLSATMRHDFKAVSVEIL